MISFYIIVGCIVFASLVSFYSKYKREKASMTTNSKGNRVHFAYASSDDGSSSFSNKYYRGASYIGVLVDELEEPSSNYTEYKWKEL